MSAPRFADLGAIARALDAGEVDAETLVDDALAAIERHADSRAFLAVDAERARRDAEAADARRRAGAARSPLDGVPLALKDNLVTEGLTTTAGSRMLARWVPPYDGAAARRLRAAGAIVLAKTNLDEFGMGSSTERSAFGAVPNPWDPTRVPGGSSGGSAYAVAAGVVPGALGSDTGGSIRQPAALCGVYGLKPTYGRVSRHGLVAYASSLDTVGPLARSPEDCARLHDLLAGPDPEDATTLDAPHAPLAPSVEATSGGLDGLRVGVPRALLEHGLDADVRARFDATLDALAARGARLVDVSLARPEAALTAYYVIAPAEAASNLARYDGLRYGGDADARASEGRSLAQAIAEQRHRGFGAEVRRRILIGTYVLSAAAFAETYARAEHVRRHVRADWARALAEVDLVATPTSPVPAFPLGARLDDPWSMYLADVFTIGPSLAGLPALSVPAGLTRERLPVGVQFVGPPLAEGRMLQTAAALTRGESPLPWPDAALRA
jgi:aspartyl-tRNA(Asn)/glutamyl-tRNA(Gln) amidotransferase subunit A